MEVPVTAGRTRLIRQRHGRVETLHWGGTVPGFFLNTVHLIIQTSHSQLHLNVKHELSILVRISEKANKSFLSTGGRTPSLTPKTPAVIQPFNVDSNLGF